MGPPMWPWRCGLIARPVSGVEWSGTVKNTTEFQCHPGGPGHIQEEQ